MRLSHRRVLLIAIASVGILVGIVIAIASQWYRLLRSTIVNWPDHYEDLSMEAAQDLVAYPICLPSYLPTEVTDVPVLEYLDVWPDDRAELVLLFRETGNTGRTVEIRQWYSSYEQLSDPDADSLRRSLVAWQVGWDKAAEVINEVKFKSFTDDNGFRSIWLVEITSPTSLKGSVAAGSVDRNVIYRVYSVLPLEETLEIAHSIYCGDQAAD